MRVTGFLVASLVHISTALAARCYDLSGLPPSSDSFQPSDPEAEVSACCSINRPQPDICMQGGLCLATMDTYNGYLYGNGCTSKTGDDEACPFACPAKANGWKSYNILPCSRDTWYCRAAEDETNCCNNNTEMLISGSATTYLGRYLDTTTNQNATSTTTATTTSTVTATASATASPSVTVVGAAVGAVLGVALIIALAGLVWMMNKMRKMNKEMQVLKQESYIMPSDTVMPSKNVFYDAPRSTELMANHA